MSDRQRQVLEIVRAGRCAAARRERHEALSRVADHVAVPVNIAAAVFDRLKRSARAANRDTDLLGSGEDSEERVRRVSVEVCGTPVEDDGVVFDLLQSAAT